MFGPWRTKSITARATNPSDHSRRAASICMTRSALSVAAINARRVAAYEPLRTTAPAKGALPSAESQTSAEVGQ